MPSSYLKCISTLRRRKLAFPPAQPQPPTFELLSYMILSLMLFRVPLSSPVTLDSALRIQLRIFAVPRQPHLRQWHSSTAKPLGAYKSDMSQHEPELDAHTRRPKKLICMFNAFTMPSTCARGPGNTTPQRMSQEKLQAYDDIAQQLPRAISKPLLTSSPAHPMLQTHRYERSLRCPPV